VTGCDDDSGLLPGIRCCLNGRMGSGCVTAPRLLHAMDVRRRVGRDGMGLDGLGWAWMGWELYLAVVVWDGYGLWWYFLVGNGTGRVVGTIRTA
jgi:hypothetical protein